MTSSFTWGAVLAGCVDVHYRALVAIAGLLFVAYGLVDIVDIRLLIGVLLELSNDIP